MNKIQKIQARNIISMSFLLIWAALFILSLFNPITHVVITDSGLFRDVRRIHNDLPSPWMLLLILFLLSEFGVLRNMTDDELEVLRNISSESKIDKKPLRGISHLASVERKIKKNKIKKTEEN